MAGVMEEECFFDDGTFLEAIDVGDAPAYYEPGNWRSAADRYIEEQVKAYDMAVEDEKARARLGR
jgi:hypothetical protein